MSAGRSVTHPAGFHPKSAITMTETADHDGAKRVITME